MTSPISLKDVHSINGSNSPNIKTSSSPLHKAGKAISGFFTSVAAACATRTQKQGSSTLISRMTRRRPQSRKKAPTINIEMRESRSSSYREPTVVGLGHSINGSASHMPLRRVPIRQSENLPSPRASIVTSSPLPTRRPEETQQVSMPPSPHSREMEMLPAKATAESTAYKAAVQRLAELKQVLEPLCEAEKNWKDAKKILDEANRGFAEFNQEPPSSIKEDFVKANATFRELNKTLQKQQLAYKKALAECNRARASYEASFQ